MNWIWLVRMAKWVRRPPSKRQIMLWFSVIGVCAVIALAEYYGFWPEALKLDGPMRRWVM